MSGEHEPRAADDLTQAWGPWRLRCVCGQPVLLMDRTEHADVMRTGCCGARYQRQGPGLLSYLDDGWGMGVGSRLPAGPDQAETEEDNL